MQSKSRLGFLCFRV